MEREGAQLPKDQINPETQGLCAGRQVVISSKTFGQLETSGKFRDYRFHHFPA